MAAHDQGDSLGALSGQWLIEHENARAPVTADLVGALCVVGLMDGRVTVKEIHAARVAGLYDLISTNGLEPIRDVEIIWAAPVRRMTPR